MNLSTLTTYTTQNDLLLNNLIEFYKTEDNMTKMLKIITGESPISLRIVDWFATNYAKKIILFIILKIQIMKILDVSKYILIIN